MSHVRRALFFSLIERYALIAINLASNLLIARLLTPPDIGVYSVSLALLSVGQVLRDFGVASYLVQEKDLSDEHVRTALGLTLTLGAGLALLVAGVAPWAAEFYREPRMRELLWVCSFNFLLLPFSTISLALLRRELAFKALAAVNLAATLAGALVSVGLAWAGWGPLGLALGGVAVSLCTGVGAWWARGERRLLRPSLSQWRRLVKFGAQSSLMGVVTSVSMDVNDLVVGKLMGFTPVALLSRAQGLMNLFHRDLMGAVRNVAYPAYARAAREGQAMEPLYLTSVTHVTVLAWPFYGFVSLYALETLRLLFGPQWDAAAPLVPVFCLAGAIAALGSLIGNLAIAMGELGRLSRLEIVFQPVRAALVVAAAWWWREPMACALALCLALLLQLPPLYVLKGRFLPNDWALLRRRLATSLGVALAALALPAALWLWVPRAAGATLPLHWFLLAIALCCLSWLVALSRFGHPMAADPAFQRLTRGWLRRVDNSPTDPKP